MYPTVREIHSKFGPYLVENKNKLDEETFARYKRQEKVKSGWRPSHYNNVTFQVLALMCEEYESLEAGEESSQGQASVTRIAKYWDQLQKEGLPPQELAGSLPSGADFSDMTGGSSGEGCSIM